MPGVILNTMIKKGGGDMSESPIGRSDPGEAQAANRGACICGARVPEGAKFCGDCGCSLPTVPARNERDVIPAKKTCPQCGSLVPKGAKHCGECGHAVASSPPVSGRSRPSVSLSDATVASPTPKTSPFVQPLTAETSAGSMAGATQERLMANTALYVILYILCMLPTYYLPYVGSNSAAVNALGVAAGVGLNPAFWLHLGLLSVLVSLAWFRGAVLEKKWLVIFPILALLFDLTPGLSLIPMVPTVMHLLAIILGVVGAPGGANVSRAGT